MNRRSEFAVQISISDDVATLETLETAAGTVPREKKKKRKTTIPQNSISQSISLEIS